MVQGPIFITGPPIHKKTASTPSYEPSHVDFHRYVILDTYPRCDRVRYNTPSYRCEAYVDTSFHDVLLKSIQRCSQLSSKLNIDSGKRGYYFEFQWVQELPTCTGF